MHKTLVRLMALLAALTLVAAGCSNDDDDVAITGSGTSGDDTDETPAADGDAAVAFESPGDGDTVAQRVDIVMTATGFTVEPASEGVHEGAGHLHVIVDDGCANVGDTITADATHIHFGGGQTEAQLFLEPGEHDLCLQAADGEHTALDLTHEISVTVDGDLPYVSLAGIPQDGMVTSPLAVTMEAANFEIEPAANGVNEGKGHFHVVVDAGCVATGEVIPNDDQHIHFGDGSSEATLELSPGEHTLCLQAADGEHKALPHTHVAKVTVA